MINSIYINNKTSDNISYICDNSNKCLKYNMFRSAIIEKWKNLVFEHIENINYDPNDIISIKYYYVVTNNMIGDMFKFKQYMNGTSDINNINYDEVRLSPKCDKLSVYDSEIYNTLSPIKKKIFEDIVNYKNNNNICDINFIKGVVIARQYSNLKEAEIDIEDEIKEYGDFNSNQDYTYNSNVSKKDNIVITCSKYDGYTSGKSIYFESKNYSEISFINPPSLNFTDVKNIEHIPKTNKLLCGIINTNDKGIKYYEKWFLCSNQFYLLWSIIFKNDLCYYIPLKKLNTYKLHNNNQTPYWKRPLFYVNKYEKSATEETNIYETIGKICFNCDYVNEIIIKSKNRINANKKCIMSDYINCYVPPPYEEVLYYSVLLYNIKYLNTDPQSNIESSNNYNSINSIYDTINENSDKNSNYHGLLSPDKYINHKYMKPSYNDSNIQCSQKPNNCNNNNTNKHTQGDINQSNNHNFTVSLTNNNLENKDKYSDVELKNLSKYQSKYLTSFSSV